MSLGDIFANGRYAIVHKLGSSAFATVWLARDQRQQCYVAIKILAANASQERDELQVYQHLQDPARGNMDNTHVARLLDQFEITGPYGKHLCLVLPFLGPSLASFSSGIQIKIHPEVARLLASQSLKAVAQLHDAGVLVGGISAANMLFKLQNVENFTLDQLYADMGQPKRHRVSPFRTLVPGDLNEVEYQAESDPDAPASWYEALDFTQVDPILIVPSITLVGFNKSVIVTEQAPTTSKAMSLSYAAPEALCLKEMSMSSDIWALACCWFELRTAEQLFSRGVFGTVDEILRNIVNALGPIPDDLNRRLQEQGIQPAPDYPTADLPPIRRIAIENSLDMKPLADRVRSIGKWKPWHYWTYEQRKEKFIELEQRMGQYISDDRMAWIEKQARRGPPPPGPLSAQEAEDFADLLGKCLRYDPNERLSLTEAKEHRWFTSKYQTEWSSESWLQKYDHGLENDAFSD